jgi:hypothetical protein
MVRRLRRAIVIFLDTHAEPLDLPSLVKVDLLASQVFHVRQEHQLRAVLLYIAPALKEASHLPAGLLVSHHLRADLRKATRAIHLLPAMDPHRLRLAPPLLLQALAPYPWIPLSYPAHLRWSKSRCLAR